MIQTDESDRYPYFEIYCFEMLNAKEAKKIANELADVDS